MRYIIQVEPKPFRHSNTKAIANEDLLRKLSIQQAITRQHGSMGMFNGPLALSVVYYMRLKLKQPRYMLDTHCISRPLLFELDRMICETCLEFLFDDMAQVVEFNSSRKYACVPGIVLEIRELRNEDKKVQETNKIQAARDLQKCHNG